MTYTSQQPGLQCLLAVLAMMAIVSCQTEPPPAATQLAAPAPTPAAQQHAPKESFSIVGVAPGEVLHLRYAPYATSRSLIWIPPGTSSVSDEGGSEPNEEERTTWQRVGYAGFVGWVNARFLKSNRPPPDPSSPPAPELASGTGLSVLHWLRCFGNSPSWSMEFGADGKAKCEGSCRGSAGLRAANVSVTYSGILQAFDLIDPQDELLLHATTRATASCRVGKSKDAHYYEFKATGEHGPLEGCCRNTGFDRGSAIGHLRRRRH